MRPVPLPCTSKNRPISGVAGVIFRQRTRLTDVRVTLKFTSTSRNPLQGLVGFYEQSNAWGPWPKSVVNHGYLPRSQGQRALHSPANLKPAPFALTCRIHQKADSKWRVRFWNGPEGHCIFGLGTWNSLQGLSTWFDTLLKQVPHSDSATVKHFPVVLLFPRGKAFVCSALTIAEVTSKPGIVRTGWGSSLETIVDNSGHFRLIQPHSKGNPRNARPAINI